MHAALTCTRTPSCQQLLHQRPVLLINAIVLLGSLALCASRTRLNLRMQICMVLMANLRMHMCMFLRRSELRERSASGLQRPRQKYTVQAPSVHV